MAVLILVDMVFKGGAGVKRLTEDMTDRRPSSVVRLLATNVCTSTADPT